MKVKFYHTKWDTFMWKFAMSRYKSQYYAHLNLGLHEYLLIINIKRSKNG